MRLAGAEEELAADTVDVLSAGRFFAGPSSEDTVAGRLRMRPAGGSYEDALASRFLRAALAACVSNHLLHTYLDANMGLRRLPRVALKASFAGPEYVVRNSAPNTFSNASELSMRIGPESG